MQARMQITYLPENIKCKKIKVWGRSDKSVDLYIKEMTSLGWMLDRVNNTDEIASTCDLIITTTPSKKPLLTNKLLKKGTHINAIGSDSPEKNELEKGVLKSADLIVADSIPQCMERGEISHAIINKVIEKGDVQELGNLIRENGTYNCKDNQLSVADLTGVAVQDIQIAKAVFKECEKLKK